MNERIKELRKQVDVDMHLHNLEDFRAMSGCFGLEGGNKIVDDYLDKFAELIVKECINEIAYIGKANEVFGDRTDGGGLNHILWTTETAIEKIKQHFGVEL